MFLAYSAVHNFHTFCDFVNVSCNNTENLKMLNIYLLGNSKGTPLVPQTIWNIE